MKLFNRQHSAAAPILLTLCLVGGASEARAALVLDVNPGGNQPVCTGCGIVTGATFGWGFDVTGSFTVDGIGIWDTDSDGFGAIPEPLQAGLWTSGGTLLASVTISDSSTPVASASGSGRWLFADIPQLTLTPGSYLIGSVFFDSIPPANIGSFTTIPEITNVVGRNGPTPDGGFQAPVDLFGFQLSGPTLRLAAQVPEPATTVALFTLGAMGLAGRRLGARK